MVKIRLTQDCEHGEKGKVLEVEEDRVQAFLDEGKSELVMEAPTFTPAPPVPEAPRKEPPKSTPKPPPPPPPSKTPPRRR